MVDRLNVVFCTYCSNLPCPHTFLASFDLFNHGVDRPDVVGIVVVVGGGQAGYNAEDPSHKESDAQKYCQDVVFIYFFFAGISAFFSIFSFMMHTPPPNDKKLLEQLDAGDVPYLSHQSLVLRYPAP